MVVRPRQSGYALGLCSNVFDTCSQSVVHIGEQVVALIPCNVCHVHGQSGSHGGMSHVASAFLHLSQFAVRSGFQFRLLRGDNQIAQEIV